MAKFPVTEFRAFLCALKVDSKELGVIRLGDNLLGTQEWVLRKIVEGLEDGKHDFVTLKCRQAGISTISLALDLFWLFKHKGMTGMLVVHEDSARDQFRTTLELYYSSLPDEWKRPVRDSNRNQLVLTTGTKLLYRVAGQKKSGKGGLGRSAAPSFLHATEMSSWGDKEGFASLRASLAQRNPNRLYHWESTARGFENLFYDQWAEALNAASMQTIFVSWWANEMYSIPKIDPRYKIYWGSNGELNEEEKTWCREVRVRYGVEITAEQIAWWRWLKSEQQPDESLRLQEYPWTEDQAFQASGSQFFNGTILSRLYGDTNKLRDPEYYRVRFGNNFTDTSVGESNAKNSTLKVWKQPVDKAFYCLGADPAYGSSDNADGFCISIWRVWSDRAEQVAEYIDYDITTAQFAWVIAYLAGAYRPCTFNLEVNGPGNSVLNELQNMQKEKNLGVAEAKPVLKDAIGNMRHYMYRRYDSIYGTPTALHTVTNFQMKERMMNNMRDYIERKMAHPVSKDLVSEMASVVRQPGEAPAAPDHRKDDRVIAAALALVAWNDQVRTKLMSSNLSYEIQMAQEIQRQNEKQKDDTVTQHMVHNYLKKVGILQKKQEPSNSRTRVYIPEQKG